MKKKNVQHKLSLKKETLSRLNDIRMDHARGGAATVPFITYSLTCHSWGMAGEDICVCGTMPM